MEDSEPQPTPERKDDDADPIAELRRVLAASVHVQSGATPREGPVPPEDALAADLAEAAATELLAIAATLREAVSPEETAARLRTLVHQVWAKLGGLDPSSEPQAKGALVDLIDFAVGANEASRVRLGDDDAALEQALRQSADWVIESLGQTFPAVAAKLRTEEKSEQLAIAIGAFWMVDVKQELGERLEGGEAKWPALEALARGVFTTSTDLAANHRRWSRGELHDMKHSRRTPRR